MMRKLLDKLIGGIAVLLAAGVLVACGDSEVQDDNVVRPSTNLPADGSFIVESMATCSMVAVEAGYSIVCDGDAVGTLTNGADGKDGKDGEGCSLAELDAGLGYQVACGETVGVILNGKDGTDGVGCEFSEAPDDVGVYLICGDKAVLLRHGKDGKDGNDGVGCNAAEIGSGYALYCGGEFIGIVKHGSDGMDGTDGADGADGINGSSCYAESIVDEIGTGFSIFCSDSLVGNIYNGISTRDTIYAYDTLIIRDSLLLRDSTYVIHLDTIVRQDTVVIKDSLVVKDTLIVKDTLVINNKDTVVVSRVDTVVVSKLDTLVLSAKDTLVISEKDTVVSIVKDTVIIKDTVVVKDTVVISHKDTVVISRKDTVFVSPEPNSSSSEELVTTGDESIWSGATYIVDDRDNQQYRIVNIGDQTWMAENLRYADHVFGESYCYEGLDESCAETGRLYTWAAVMNGETVEGTQGICPDNWHVPSSDEWGELYSNTSGNRTLLQDYSWKDGKDRFGFSAKISGQYTETASEYNPAGFSNGWDASYERGYSASFWTSSENTTTDAMQWYFYESFNGGDGEWDYASADKNTAFAVRCIRNSKIAVAVPTPKKVVVLGSTGETVRIGTQVWMTENVPGVVDWATAMGLPSEYLSETASGVVNAKQQGVCPEGFHVPHNSEWYFLKNYIARVNAGLESVAASLMDEASWPAIDGATNAYKFSALPIGSMSLGFDGDLLAENATYFWSATEDYEERHAHYFSLVSGEEGLVEHHNNYNKPLKFSVRCIRD